MLHLQSECLKLRAHLLHDWEREQDIFLLLTDPAIYYELLEIVISLPTHKLGTKMGVCPLLAMESQFQQTLKAVKK